MSDTKPEVIETQIATLDVRDASAQGLALMEERTRNQKKMLAIAIGLTSPNQWVVFSGTGPNGEKRESVYPTGGSADTILRRAFGLTWAEKTITMEDTPDGRLATCHAWLMRGEERMEHFTGYRLMGGYTKTEPDLRKGALENMKSVAVRDLLGLRFRTPAELKEMGLDVSKLERRAEFQSHEKDPSTVTVPFGRDKGKPITDVDNPTLEWLAEAVKKSLADPQKARWKTKNEALLEALRDEFRRRHAPAEKPQGEEPKKGKGKKTKAEDAPSQEPPPGEQPDTGFGPPPMTPEETREARDVTREEYMREPGEEG